jgi:hypothetical protein
MQSDELKDASGPAVDTLLGTTSEAIGQIPEPSTDGTDSGTSSDTQTPAVAGLYQGFATAANGNGKAYDKFLATYNNL